MYQAFSGWVLSRPWERWGNCSLQNSFTNRGCLMALTDLGRYSLPPGTSEDSRTPAGIPLWSENFVSGDTGWKGQQPPSVTVIVFISLSLWLFFYAREAFSFSTTILGTRQKPICCLSENKTYLGIVHFYLLISLANQGKEGQLGWRCPGASVPQASDTPL